MPFKKGNNANPLGPGVKKRWNAKKIAGAVAMAQDFSTDALLALRRVIKDKKSAPSAVVSAAVAILDRAHGRPVAYSAEDDRRRMELDALTDVDLARDLERLRSARLGRSAGDRAPAPQPDKTVAH